jgi:iron-sulfur cluster insertion protein
MKPHIIPMLITITSAASTRIKTLCAENNAEMVRLSVDGGGCSGFQYVFGFADKANADDTVIEHEGAKLVVDSVSIPFLDNATLDFIDGLAGSHFKVSNPQATSSCGCGTSFGV